MLDWNRIEILALKSRAFAKLSRIGSQLSRAQKSDVSWNFGALEGAAPRMKGFENSYKILKKSDYERIKNSLNAKETQQAEKDEKDREIQRLKELRLDSYFYIIWTIWRISYIVPLTYFWIMSTRKTWVWCVYRPMAFEFERTRTKRLSLNRPIYKTLLWRSGLKRVTFLIYRFPGTWKMSIRTWRKI